MKSAAAIANPVRRLLAESVGYLLASALLLVGTVICSDAAARAIEADSGCVEIVADARSNFPLNEDSLPDVLMRCIGFFAAREFLDSDGVLHLDGVDFDDYLGLTGIAINRMKAGGAKEVNRYRQHDDDLLAVWALAAGTAADNPLVRRSSVQVLSDILDNSTMCVMLDRVYGVQEIIDSRQIQLNTEEGYLVRGRANLIHILRVVAKWAFKENHLALGELYNYLRKRIDPNDSNLSDTNKVLVDLNDRLNNQLKIEQETLYSEIPAPRKIRHACETFQKRGSEGPPPFRVSTQWTIY